MNDQAVKPLETSASRSPIASAENQPALSETPAAQPNTRPVDQFTEAHKTSLRELGIPIVIPAYIPAGFQVSQVIANLCPNDGVQRGGCREGSNYTLVYRNDQNTCFLVNAVGGGVGGGAAEFEFLTQTVLLGEVAILFGKPSGANQAPTPEQLQLPQQKLWSFPASMKSAKTPLYNVVVGDSAYYQETYGCGANTSVTPLELEKVVQSLALLE